MRRRKLTGDLHVLPEVPEHFQSDVGDVNNVRAECDRRRRMLAVRALCAQGLGEACQVLVERNQAQELRWCLSVRLGLAVCRLGVFLVGCNRLGVEVGYPVDVDWHATFVMSVDVALTRTSQPFVDNLGGL